MAFNVDPSVAALRVAARSTARVISGAAQDGRQARGASVRAGNASIAARKAATVCVRVVRRPCRRRCVDHRVDSWIRAMALLALLGKGGMGQRFSACFGAARDERGTRELMPLGASSKQREPCPQPPSSRAPLTAQTLR